MNYKEIYNPIEIIKTELNLTAKAILESIDKLNTLSIQKALELLINCKGKVVLTGLGKSGIVAKKISATLASTGTTSIFLHAAEGIHGDLGMVQENDLVIAVSNSGTTQELLSIIPYIKFIQIPLIAMTGNKNSALAENADVVLDCSVPSEYEPLGLVPTISTTVTLAIGDAIAVALLKYKNFEEKDFARFHPGGTIGKKLLLRVSDLMHTGKELPSVSRDEKMSSVILEMTSKKLGCTTVIDEKGILIGMITDGDLRRQLLNKACNLLHFTAEECMTSNPKTIQPEELAINALNLMETYKITMLPVIDQDLKPIGLLHMHDLIQAGII